MLTPAQLTRLCAPGCYDVGTTKGECGRTDLLRVSARYAFVGDKIPPITDAHRRRPPPTPIDADDQKRLEERL